MDERLTVLGPCQAAADGRFAPSPSGPLHLGNLRTALAAWALARAQEARFIVRIEDLDPGRSRAAVADAQLADLAALGLEWDGPVVRQSERATLYEEALSRLRRDGLLYRCWCTRAEIRDAVSAPHGPAGDRGYPGTCRDLTAAQVADREAAGRPAALRVRAGGEAVRFDDRACGPQEAVVDDFVVRRGDGAYAYNLAVVVDDREQGVGEVVRGADLLETTPRQVWLQGRLGFPRPSYLHVPLMLGPDGDRLAKRHGAVTLAERTALGESAAQVRAELARQLGLLPPGEVADPAAIVAAARALVAAAA
jgi:glutamyl-tRNA synthetase